MIKKNFKSSKKVFIDLHCTFFENHLAELLQEREIKTEFDILNRKY